MSFIDKILGYLKKPSPAKEGRINIDSGAQISQGGVDGSEISDNPTPVTPEPVQPLVKEEAQPIVAEPVVPVAPVAPEPVEEVIAEAPIEPAAPATPEATPKAPVVPEPVTEPIKEEVPVAPVATPEPAPVTPEPVVVEPATEVADKGPNVGGAAPATSIEELEKRMDGPEPKITAQEGGPEAANGDKPE